MSGFPTPFHLSYDTDDDIDPVVIERTGRILRDPQWRNPEWRGGDARPSETMLVDRHVSVRAGLWNRFRAFMARARMFRSP